MNICWRQQAQQADSWFYAINTGLHEVQTMGSLNLYHCASKCDSLVKTLGRALCVSVLIVNPKCDWRGSVCRVCVFQERHRLDGPPIEWAICKWGYQLYFCLAVYCWHWDEHPGTIIISPGTRHPDAQVMTLCYWPCHSGRDPHEKWYQGQCVSLIWAAFWIVLSTSGRKAKKGAEQW